MEDVRWKQRFSNLNKAFTKLQKAIQLFDFDEYVEQRESLQDEYNSSNDESINETLEGLELRREGLIQRFEYCYELFINTLRDLMLDKGVLKEKLAGSKSVLTEALDKGFIEDHDLWREMVLARNDTSHTYNNELADEITEKIQNDFYPLMKKLFNRLNIENERD